MLDEQVIIFPRADSVRFSCCGHHLATLRPCERVIVTCPGCETRQELSAERVLA
jgi:hypothetical protein